MDKLNPRVYLDPDPAMTAAADDRVPTQKAVVDLVSGSAGGGGGSGGHRWGGAVDTVYDVIIDSTTSGLVLKSPNLHYWRIKITDAGALTATDLGTTKP